MKNLIQEAPKFKKIVSFDKIYVIAFYKNIIRFQGCYSKELKSEFESLGFKFQYDKEHKWYEAIKDGIEIILTE